MKIPGLLERYQLRTRRQLNARLQALEVNLSHDVDGEEYASPVIVQALDDLHEWLAKGGKLAAYTPLSRVMTVSTPQSQGVIDVSAVADGELDPDGFDEDEDETEAENPTPSPSDPALAALLVNLSDAIAARSPLSPSASPLQVWRELEEACHYQWLLSTSQVRTLTGIVPSGDICEYGVFRFKRQGKIGREAAWEVWKMT